MKIWTSRFGSLQIDKGEIFYFPQGIIGMLGEEEFIFLQQQDQPPFIWLQSTKTPDLAFVVTDPWFFVQEYSFNLGPREYSLLQMDKGLSPYTLVTVNLSSMEEITLNLKGPLLFNRHKRRGMQLVLEGDVYPLRYSIPLKVLQSV